MSNASADLKEAERRWRNRDLSTKRIKYLIVDGVTFPMRMGNSIERVPVLVAIGVREDATRLVVGIQAGDKESAAAWREFFKDLKKQGFDGSLVRLGIMDGLSGLETVFREEFSRAQIQRCQVHVARNVRAKVPVKFRQAVADDLCSIFYTSSRKKAAEFATAFADRWEKISRQQYAALPTPSMPA